MSDDTREPDEADEPAEADDAPVIDVADWFGDRREVWLELGGVRYRLRITRRNKLILQNRRAASRKRPDCDIIGSLTRRRSPGMIPS